MGEGSERNRPCPCGSGLKYKNCCLGKPPLALGEGQILSEADKEAFAAILDDIADEYLDDHQAVYPSEHERLRAYFAWLRTRNEDWERSQDCKFPDCTQRSVKRSHTIPRAALSLIAEDGHLLRPQFNHVSGQLELARIGLNRASTFAGFCEPHERTFQKFESILRMRDDADLALQVFRTVCREIAIKEHQLRHFKGIAGDFRTRRGDWASKRAEDALRKKFRVGADFSVRNFDIQADDGPAEFERKLDSMAGDLVRFKGMFFEPFLNAQNSGALAVNLVRHRLPERLPLALAGRGNFVLRTNESGSKGRETLAVMNVLPSKDGTEIFMCVPNDHAHALLFYMRHFAGEDGDRDGVLRMIESWMLHGSDHWLLSPSAWFSLPESQRASVLKAMIDPRHNIGAEPTVPVLEAVRDNPCPV